jgi:hypothetical protein
MLLSKSKLRIMANKKKTNCLGTFTLITQTGMLWKTMRQMCEMHEQTYLNWEYIHITINGAQQSSVLSPSLFPSLPPEKFQDVQSRRLCFNTSDLYKGM